MGGMGGAMPPRPNMISTGIYNRLNIMQSQSIIVVQGEDGTSWEAMSLEPLEGDRGGTWQRLTIPTDITVTPVLGPDTAAFWLKGKAIDHVAAFSKSRGEWSKQHLLKPAEGELMPVIGPGCALYQVGNDFYAFSAETGKWGALHLEAAEKGLSALYPNHVEVLQGNKLYIFSTKNGEWSPGVAVKLLAPRVQNVPEVQEEMRKRSPRLRSDSPKGEPSAPK
jgi:hypothetical protein